MAAGRDEESQKPHEPSFQKRLPRSPDGRQPLAARVAEQEPDIFELALRACARAVSFRKMLIEKPRPEPGQLPIESGAELGQQRGRSAQGSWREKLILLSP